MKHYFLLLLTFILFSNLDAQTQFWSDNFEDAGAPSSGTRTPSVSFFCPTSPPPATAYFNRVATSDIAMQAGPYTAFQGSKFWAGEDIDQGPTCVNSSISSAQNVTWTGINISGKTGLSFRGLFAAQGNIGGTWESLAFGANQDYIILEYRIDGGAYTKALGFYATASSGATNTLALDANNDLVGEGTSLAYAFQEFTFSIPSTGTILDLRVSFSSNNSGSEEMAVDNFRLFEAPACSNPTINIPPSNASVCHNGNTSFSVAATGATGYQWQLNAGFGFNNITNGGVYSNVTTATLNIIGATTGMDGYLYRCITSNGACSTTSSQATLTVSNPTLTLLSQTNVSCNGGSNGAAVVNPATGGISPYTYNWTPGNPTGDGTTSVTGLTHGTWTCTVTDLNGCTANQVFTITQPAILATTSTVTACNTYTLNGQTYTTSGTYMQLLSSVNGCDSTVTLNLTVNYSTTSLMNVTACSSYTLNGQTYTASGAYIQNLTNVAGCDSTLTLNLIINQPSSSSITQASCYTYTLNGQTYTASGTYTQTLSNALGCDSIITLNLTIFNATSSNITVTACDSYTLGNQTYTTSGTYLQTISNVGGCDSVVTLNLTITESSSSSFSDVACEFYTWNGTSYFTSGTYTQTFTNAVGCDSIVTLNLTINMSYENTTTVSACDSYDWNGQTYTVSGVYTVTDPNMNGCDSTEHLNLMILTSPIAGIIVLDPIILYATGTGIYQWIDCTTGQALAGETNQNLVATYNGSFAVVVSNGNCSDTSNCETINTIGLDENNGIVTIQLVPNPASNDVTITWSSVEEEANIVVFDTQGKEVLVAPNFKSGQALTIAQFETGMYLVLIKTASSQTIERLIKQ